MDAKAYGVRPHSVWLKEIHLVLVYHPVYHPITVIGIVSTRIERVSFQSDLINRLVQFWASATLLGVERSGPSFVLVWQARSERKRRNNDVAQPLWSTWGEYRRYSE